MGHNHQSIWQIIQKYHNLTCNVCPSPISNRHIVFLFKLQISAYLNQRLWNKFALSNIHAVKRVLIIWIISINIVYIHPVWCIIVSWSVFKNRITAKTLCMYNSVGEQRWLWIICTVPTNPTLLIYDMTLCCNMWNNFWLILCLKSFSWNTSCLNYAKHGQEITHHQEGEIIKSSK